MDPYRFRDFYIRPDMLEGIQMYVEHGLEPGGFLTAVICNDLQQAVGRADDENLHNLPAFVAYFYNECPSPCWGSEDKMNAWIKSRREALKAVEETDK